MQPIDTVIAQARQALARGDVQRARRLTEQARAMRGAPGVAPRTGARLTVLPGGAVVVDDFLDRKARGEV